MGNTAPRLVSRFDTLKFENRAEMGIGAVKFFDNGYGVSVIRGPYTYGGPEGLYELAVLRGNERDSELCYDSGITDDVMGSLSPEEVSEAMEQVANLKPRGN